MKKMVWCYPLVAILAVAIAGCGSGETGNREKTVPAKGIVKYKGNPVEGAIVTLTTRDQKRSSFGKTDQSGQFTLTTFQSGDGVVPGDYLVKIVKTEAPPASHQGDIDAGDYQPPEETPNAAPAAPKNLLPARYAQAETSQLSATIGEKGADNLEFDLKD
jgi:hypothetical protein